MNYRNTNHYYQYYNDSCVIQKNKKHKPFGSAKLGLYSGNDVGNYRKIYFFEKDISKKMVKYLIKNYYDCGISELMNEIYK